MTLSRGYNNDVFRLERNGGSPGVVGKYSFWTFPGLRLLQRTLNKKIEEYKPETLETIE